ncbi:hypothetical protein EI94DRAFT_1727667 [Lactarius quietus]|nr:hypothetical protein EI94DRAFT_1727667 [Lactarius quietus]
MPFHKSLVSFVTAISLAWLASSVTAATIPSCGPGQGTLTCCGSTTSFQNLTPAEQTALSVADLQLNTNLAVGLNCMVASHVGALTGCNLQSVAVCCNPIQNQYGLPNVAANCIAA